MSHHFQMATNEDCDDLPPPPGIEDEQNGHLISPQAHLQNRILVSPRPIKNPVHDIQVSFFCFHNALGSIHKQRGQLGVLSGQNVAGK